DGTAAAFERPQLVEKGLPALDVPAKLWDLMDRDDRPDVAKSTADALYSERIAYARRVGWVLAPELELLDRFDRLDQDATVTLTKTMTKWLLQARVDTARAQAELVQKDVELKTELLRQQGEVTKMLHEFLEQARIWRALAATGKHFLVGLTL